MFISNTEQMVKSCYLCKIILIFKLTLFLPFKVYSSLPTNTTGSFGDCGPKTCGNLSITYPFYIVGKQEIYCGYPGFEIICKDDILPYINISSVSYVVKNVSYDEQTIQVVNSMLYNSFNNDNNTCSESLQHLNVTFNRDLFGYTAKHSDILLLLYCTNKDLVENSPNMVFCGAVGVYKNESRLRDLEGTCEGLVYVPYEDEKMEIGRVKEMLQEGFSLKWTVNINSCNDCKQSGGECGYDKDISRFTCFCFDRVHSHDCLAQKKNAISFTSRKLKIKPSITSSPGHTTAGSKTILHGPHPYTEESMIHFGQSLFVALPFLPIRKTTFNWGLFAILLGASGLAGMILVCIFTCVKRKIISTAKIAFPWSIRDEGNQNVEAFLKVYGSFVPERYTYSDIKQMTTSFKHKLGEGGYGTVYKGKLPDGRLVAVKKLKNVKGNGKEFINEVVSISRTNHVNIVTLLGFCSEGINRALVYEFMLNGSLEKYISREENKQQLSQETLLDIAVGVAKGLDYLHKGCNARILHLDIKPHNILLDEQFFPKISDFGLAKLSETKNSMTFTSEARGTIGYIAPEVFCRTFGAVSHKSDVYSYGMMVLDMACGRNNVLVQRQNSSEQYFPDWIYAQLELEVEDEIHGNGDDDKRGLLRKMILVGLWCIQTYPSSRPSMNRVVEMLEGESELIEMPPKPLLCSPPRSEIVGSSISVPVPSLM